MNLVAAVALVLAQGRGVDSLAGRVRQLADSYLAAYFERHPDEATLDGVAGGPDDRLPDDSPLAPRGNVRISLTQLDSLLGTPLGRSPLLDPARRDTTPAFRVELERMLTTDVLPALRGYRDFLERDYLPRARSAIGVSANPDGAACYRASIRATTGLDLSPDAVRRLGIATVAALEAEMRVIARRSFRTRDVGALLGRLRTAAAFTFRSRRAMLDAARGAVLRAKAAMPAWFGRLPRADIVVEPYPAFRERESVGEWNPPAEDGSRPGIYFLSTYDPGHKARADLEALTFHETIPGHHLQGSIALERGQAIPAIARYFWSPGFGEGWAEYAEQLADEMGLYSSDTARLGALADITLSAALLVVDTGINAFGWTREQGIAYIRDRTRVPRLRAEVPVDRYPIWRSEEHTSELQSRQYLVCRLLLEKKKDERHDHEL